MVFEEKQKFRQKLLWTFLILFHLISISYLSYLRDFAGASVLAVSLVAVSSLFYYAELRVKVEADGIKIRFYPFHLKTRVIEYNQIKDFSAEKYSPFKEFGGWGLRWRPGKFAYNVSGNQGIRVKKKNGKEVMIGSQRPKEMEEAIEERMN